MIRSKRKARLQVFDEPLQEGDEMFGLPDVPRDSLIQHIFGEHFCPQSGQCTCGEELTWAGQHVLVLSGLICLLQPRHQLLILIL